jgi:MFS family permease
VPDAPPERAVGYVRLFRGNRNLRLLWTGQTMSQVGDVLYDVGLVWLALQVSDSDPLAVGAVIFARAIPYLFFGLIAGAYADRWDRRRTMIVSDALRAVVALAIPLLHVLGSVELWHLVAAAFVLTTVRSFFQPALQAALPGVVPATELQTANAALHASQQTAVVLAPVAAGFVIAAASPYALFVANSATFALSVLTLLPLVVARRTGAPAGPAIVPSLRRELAAAATEIRTKPEVLWSLITFGLGLTALAGVIRVGLPIYAEDGLHGGAREYGLMLGAMGVGTVVGALLVGKRPAMNYRFAFFGAWMAWGALFAAVGFAPVLAVALVILVLAGCAEAITDVAVVSMLQTTVRDDLLGKTFSAWATVANVGDSVSGLLVGAALASFTVPAVFATAGACAVLISAVGWLRSAPRAGPAASTVEGRSA